MKTILLTLALASLLLTVAPATTAAADADTVRQVERALSARGYTAGPADGRWDSATRQALQQFQRAQGLTPTGEVDAKTLAVLGIEMESSPAVESR